jgi:hypothetical protein
MQVVRAREGLWLDTSAKLGPTAIAAIKAYVEPGPLARRVVGVVRTLPLPSETLGREITRGEAELLVGANLQLALYQRVRLPGWDPATHSGAADAMHAVAAARAATYPEGAVIYQDLEGISGTAASTEKFANDCCDALFQLRAQPGEYAGYQDPLDPAGLYRLHRATTYWCDFGPRTVAVRGHAMKQHAPEIVLAGVRFDRNTMAEDLLGDLPWVASAA